MYLLFVLRCFSKLITYIAFDHFIYKIYIYEIGRINNYCLKFSIVFCFENLDFLRNTLKIILQGIPKLFRIPSLIITYIHAENLFSYRDTVGIYSVCYPHNYYA